jgi:hypothetical protein
VKPKRRYQVKKRKNISNLRPKRDKTTNLPLPLYNHHAENVILSIMSAASSPAPILEDDHQVLVTLKLSSKLLTQLTSTDNNNNNNSTPTVTSNNSRKSGTPKSLQGQPSTPSNNINTVSSATANSTTRGSSNVSTNAARNALDRTGKPARKWTKTNIELKSFTGFKYEIVAWSGGPKDLADEDEATSGSKTPPPSQQSVSDQNTPGSIPGTPSLGALRRNGGSLLAQSPLTPSDL